MKKQEFNPKGFSLVIKNPNIYKKITIPDIDPKWSVRATVGGEETYQMAIDSFTTKFKSETELLDYLKETGQINQSIQGVSLVIEYHGGGNYFNGDIQPVFSDNKELVDFIKTYPIAPNFLGKALDRDGCIAAFKTDLLENLTTYPYKDEYLIAMKTPNKYYGNDLVAFFNSDQALDVLRDEESYNMSLCQYHNIRGHMIAKHNNRFKNELENIIQTEIYNNIPYNERGEAENQEIYRSVRR